MIHLTPNAGIQSFSVSPFQQRKYLPMPGYLNGHFSNYLVIFKEMATGEEFAVKPLVTLDNERQTIMQMATNANVPLLAQVLIKNSGLYTYTIWAMQDDDQLIPDQQNALGILETGVARFAAEEAWNTPTISMPDNVVYYE